MGCFRPEGSGHRPRTLARLLYDGEGLYGRFLVEDRYVRSVQAGNGAPVYRDSCVELFVQPSPGRGYLNFEFNAGGFVLASHVVDPTRTPDGFREYAALADADYARVRVHHSLPSVVDPEVGDPVTWTLAFFVPF
ncbi:MAG: hypothetical protein HGA98_01225, partial [Deltaproteobacteria bacterium]|nr:hypothetical protein [Deltaproteobacteria bacterium]